MAEVVEVAEVAEVAEVTEVTEVAVHQGRLRVPCESITT